MTRDAVAQPISSTTSSGQTSHWLDDTLQPFTHGVVTGY